MTANIRIAIAAALTLSAATFTMPGLADEPIGSVATTMADAAATAPNFVGISNWFNTAPLNISDLRGKVVLVDFWTYGCYNCVNTLPHVTKLHAAFKDKGLVIVGVHTPEFPFERSAANVQAAIKRYGIEYPVAQDNASATWDAYHNQYWPAQYIIDQNGKIVFSHDGEGQYDEIERTIQKLLQASS
jgi:thiol-disulfide isomerase/thioredoxin